MGDSEPAGEVLGRACQRARVSSGEPTGWSGSHSLIYGRALDERSIEIQMVNRQKGCPAGSSSTRRSSRP
jgi:hypothetical protein